MAPAAPSPGAGRGGRLAAGGGGRSRAHRAGRTVHVGPGDPRRRGRRRLGSRAAAARPGRPRPAAGRPDRDRARPPRAGPGPPARDRRRGGVTRRRHRLPLHRELGTARLRRRLVGRGGPGLLDRGLPHAGAAAVVLPRRRRRPALRHPAAGRRGGVRAQRRRVGAGRAGPRPSRGRSAATPDRAHRGGHRRARRGAAPGPARPRRGPGRGVPRRHPARRTPAGAADPLTAPARLPHGWRGPGGRARDGPGERHGHRDPRRGPGRRDPTGTSPTRRGADHAGVDDDGAAGGGGDQPERLDRLRRQPRGDDRAGRGPGARRRRLALGLRPPHRGRPLLRRPPHQPGPGAP